MTFYHLERLRLELELRKEKNARYSLRGFAHFLQLHPSALSRILRGKQGLSVESARVVIKKLALPNDEKLLFVGGLAQQKLEELCSDLAKVVGAPFSSESIKSHLGLGSQPVSPQQNAFSDNPALYQEIVEFLPQPSWVLDNDGNIICSNKEGSAHLGLKDGEGAHCDDLLHASDLTAYREEWARAKTANRTFQITCRLVFGDGHVSKSLRAMPFRDSLGSAFGWLCIASDLPDAKSSNQSDVG